MKLGKRDKIFNLNASHVINEIWKDLRNKGEVTECKKLCSILLDTLENAFHPQLEVHSVNILRKEKSQFILYTQNNKRIYSDYLVLPDDILANVALAKSEAVIIDHIQERSKTGELEGFKYIDKIPVDYESLICIPIDNMNVLCIECSERKYEGVGINLKNEWDNNIRSKCQIVKATLAIICLYPEN